MNNNYDSSKIKILKGLEAIRTRPGMYIGDVGERGLHHCVFEVLDNAIDEADAGFGKNIKLTKLKNGGIRIEDQGRGIPTAIHPEEGISSATVVLTILHAGGKFDKDSYSASGGLHGVGIKATNATSEYLKITIHREGKIWQQEFERGIPKEELKIIGNSNKTGTIMEFIPDKLLFDNIDYKEDILINRLRNSSFLSKGIEFIYINEETGESHNFISKDGLTDFIHYLVPKENRLIKSIQFQGSDEKRGTVIDKTSGKTIENDGILEKLDIDVVLLYEKGHSTVVKSYVNKINTPGGGVHEQGVLDALSSSIIKKVKEAKLPSKRDMELLKSVNIDDVREGLIMIISLTLYTEISFEGQTKDKLGGQYIRGMIRDLAKKKIETFLDENPQISDQIIKKIIAARKARESAERARKIERKAQQEEVGSLLGKLSDCRSNNPEECELFLVEGDSAGGCIAGETLIKLSNGSVFKIEEICEKYKNGENLFIESYDLKSNSTKVSLIKNAWKTKRTSNLVKVFLSNGKEIICTPEHLFLLADGTYLEAEFLKGKESMSLSERIYFLNVEKYNEELDVYDLEIPITHNFILEAGIFIHNSAKQGRNGLTQAILPLKGKPMNTLKNKEADILKNEEILSIKTALGCGIGNDNIDLSKLRYHKIIEQTDADIDGSHIQQLLNTMWNTLFKPLLLNGHIYKAVPPLHRVKYGKEIKYFKDDSEKKEFISTKRKEISNSIKQTKKYKELEEDKKNDYLKKEIEKEMSKYVFNRFKGLGEMNPDQLAETTMIPETRQIIQLKPDNLYDLSDEIDLELEDIENKREEILQIIERRKKERNSGSKDKLIELNTDSIILLVSSQEGTAFREKFLLKNIKIKEENKNDNE